MEKDSDAVTYVLVLGGGLLVLLLLLGGGALVFFFWAAPADHAPHAPPAPAPGPVHMAPTVEPKLKAWHLKEAAVNWLKAQDKDKALAAARAAVAGDPESRNQLLAHFWHRGLGEVFLETAQYPLAIEHLEKAIQNSTIEGYIKDCQKKLEEARMKSRK